MHLPHNRGGFRSWLILFGLLAFSATPQSVAWGVPFLVVGIAIHLWSKGCLHQHAEITATGPYRFVRHPFYLGNAFIDLSITVMSGWWLLLLVFPFWWLGVYVPVMRREERDMEGIFGEAYRAFCRRLPALIPCRWPVPPGAGTFSWTSRNILKTELPRAFRFLTYPFLFLIGAGLAASSLAAGGLVAGVIRYFSQPGPEAVAVWAACLALCAVSWELKRHFAARKAILPAWANTFGVHLALRIGVLAVGAWVNVFSVDLKAVTFPAGYALLLVSLLAHRRWPRQTAAAEGILWVGYAILCGLPWFAALLAPLCLALFLDAKLGQPASAASTEARPSRGDLVYYLLVLIAAVAPILKEWRA